MIVFATTIWLLVMVFFLLVMLNVLLFVRVCGFYVLVVIHYERVCGFYVLVVIHYEKPVSSPVSYVVSV